jgi:hypothetical protein
MAEELGKIIKPEPGKYEDKRKLYLVPLLYSWQEAPAEYAIKFDIYWQQVGEHISNLESRIGAVNRIYHESISAAGDEGLKILEKVSPSSYKIIKEKCERGAGVEATEDTELADECLDWERHLLLGFISQKVANLVSESFVEATKKRYEYIADTIDKTLKEKEAALLFIREGHRVQFPKDIEVFSIAPPMLDDIHRWMRERSSADLTQEEKAGPTGEKNTANEGEPEEEKKNEP